MCKRDSEYSNLERDDTMGAQPLGNALVGLIGSIELPHGVHLLIGVNLDDKELESSQALEGGEELWSPGELPSELLKEGTGEELASMKGFCGHNLVPLVETTLEEQRKATPARWVNAHGEETKPNADSWQMN